LVPGGSFYQCYDGHGKTDRTHPATISAFRLDAYEVTVGRFRQFVSSVIQGKALPGSGAGKHDHLNGGLGLVSPDDAGPGFESGWDPSWTASLARTAPDWNARLTDSVRCPSTPTWTEQIRSNEVMPITCVDWYSAYAFCIWDQGFLPSSAEWNYAAAGGAEQRVYPWGQQAPEANADLAIWNCNYGGGTSCPSLFNIARVGSAPSGNGKFGQADLAGNVYEWVLDSGGFIGDPLLELPATCNDCANIGMGPRRLLRGGSFYSNYSQLLVSSLLGSAPDKPHPDVGFRCAHDPSFYF
jgi:formylglycine-generating enzyme required for sulfatase activity